MRVAHAVRSCYESADSDEGSDHSEPVGAPIVLSGMAKFLLWCILLVLCWPLALLALVLYPFVWLVLLPFRLAGIAVDGVLGLLRAVVMFPARLVGGSGAR